MADENDDSWLYGAGDDASQHTREAPDDTEIQVTVKNGNLNESKSYEFDEHNFEEAGDHEHLIAEDSKDDIDEGKDQQGGDLDDSDDDDDDINVVIGDIKSGGASYNVKNQQQQDKQKLPGSKFNIEEFETVGSINGQPAFEFAIESIEDKPWRKPGADITDYFNYGFNEETWRAYCERQKKMRIHESGVGLAGLTAAQNPQGNTDGKTGINIGIKRIGGPRKMGTIDVIGAPSQTSNIRPPAPRENVIQVMTADRREYSRTVVGNANLPIPMQFNVPPEEFYNHEEQDAFNYGYEPTQDSQWDPHASTNAGWQPSEIKELTPGVNRPPPAMVNPPIGIPPMPLMPGIRMGVPPPMMQPNQPQQPPMAIPPLMGQITSLPPSSSKPPPATFDNRSRERDERERRGAVEDRRGVERFERRRSRSREKSRERKSERPERSERTRVDRYRETRETSTRRRSKSREKSRRSRSRDKSRRSRSKDRKADDKDRSSRSDKSKLKSKKDDV